jgi:hypothetical protein
VDFFISFFLALVVCLIVKTKIQQRRIAFLAHFLAPYSIEKNIETLTQGYLRALGEADADRREQVWGVLRGTELELCRQVNRLAGDFAAAQGEASRVTKLPVWLPFAASFAPTFDMREALRIHARGICRAIEGDSSRSPRDRAFAVSAELFLMQHTCHWFCRSRSVASTRLLARHRTSYRQVLAAVLPQTRAEYLGLVSLVR